jgi:hypothetical protein
VEKGERDLIMRQGIVLPETPKDRREHVDLEEDLGSMPLRGKPLPLRLRNFMPRADAYLAAARGPMAYMVRLHAIEAQIEAGAERLGAAWRALAAACDGDAVGFSREWRSAAERWSFFEVNDLIDRHNRWYPAESRLPMDPLTGDYALLNGRDYRLKALDSGWVLERFPAELELAAAST